MSKNILFNLIHDVIYLNNKCILNLQLLTHKNSGTRYFFFELPELKKQVGAYELINHHVSVYEEAGSAFDAKSQYHYTGFFKKEGVRYQLHVYFDAEDTIVFKPLLSEFISENECTPVACLEDEAIFKKFTSDSIEDLVRFFRSEQEAQVKMCQEKYEVLEKAAHEQYQQLPASKEKYLTLINQLIEQLNVTLCYANSTAHFVSSRKFLKSLMTSVEEIKEPVINKTNKQPLRQQKKPATNLKTRNKPNTNKIKPSIDVLVSKLQPQIKKTTTMKLYDQMEHIKSQYAEVKEMELLLSIGEYTGSIQGIHQMHECKLALEKAGINVLIGLLMQDKLKEAKELQVFNAHLQPKDLAKLALFLNKPMLLKFLLKNRLLSIHHNNFVISEVTYASMMDYCFKSTTEKRSMLNCLSVLMEYGASLLDVDNSTGLPFFVQLILNEEHVFRQLLKHPKVDNSVFYAQASKIMQTLPEGSEITHLDIQKITAYLFNNSQLLNTKTIKADGFIVDDFVKQQQEHDALIKQFLGDDLYYQLKTDSELMEIETTFQRRLKKTIDDSPALIKSAVLDMTSSQHMGPIVFTPFQVKDTLPSFDEVKSQIVSLRTDQFMKLNILRILVDTSISLVNKGNNKNKQAQYFDLMSGLSSFNTYVSANVKDECTPFKIMSYQDYRSSMSKSTKKNVRDVFFKEIMDEKDTESQKEIKSQNITNDGM